MMTADQMMTLLVWGGIASTVLLLMLIGYGCSAVFARWLRGRKG